MLIYVPLETLYQRRQGAGVQPSIARDFANFPNRTTKRFTTLPLILPLLPSPFPPSPFFHLTHESPRELRKKVSLCSPCSCARGPLFCFPLPLTKPLFSFILCIYLLSFPPEETPHHNPVYSYFSHFCLRGFIPAAFTPQGVVRGFIPHSTPHPCSPLDIRLLLW